jgi:FecR-like protein
MSDDYLWDKSGKPDPEIEALERSLSTLGHQGEPLDLPERIETAAPKRDARRAGWIARIVWPREKPALPDDLPVFGVPSRTWAVAAAAMVALGGVALLLVTRLTPAWPVSRLDGAPRVGARSIEASGRLAVGEWLETDASSRARVTVGAIGEVVVEPNTRLRLLEAGDRRQRLHLALGTVMAVITAPPRQFVVETPSARAVDLGCAYTLEVDRTGAALVTVLAGWVSFEHEGREAFIPAGARCATRPGSGPGTPYFTDASAAFKNALTLLDVAPGDPARGERLASVLSEARREDAFTLWHLLARSTGAERDLVYARLSDLVPPPAGVTREGILGGDRAMLDRWWDELGFGEMKWWRLWQRSWPTPGGPPVGPS